MGMVVYLKDNIKTYLMLNCKSRNFRHVRSVPSPLPESKESPSVNSSGRFHAPFHDNNYQFDRNENFKNSVFIAFPKRVRLWNSLSTFWKSFILCKTVSLKGFQKINETKMKRLSNHVYFGGAQKVLLSVNNLIWLALSKIKGLHLFVIYSQLLVCWVI